MPSITARAMSARVVARESPVRAAVAFGRHEGVRIPASAGTNHAEPFAGAFRASSPISAGEAKKPRSSQSQRSAEPVVEQYASRLNCVTPPCRQPGWASTPEIPGRGSAGCSPVATSTKAPVPYTHMPRPAARPPSAISAACWSPIVAATGTEIPSSASSVTPSHSSSPRRSGSSSSGKPRWAIHSSSHACRSSR